MTYYQSNPLPNLPIDEDKPKNNIWLPMVVAAFGFTAVVAVILYPQNNPSLNFMQSPPKKSSILMTYTSMSDTEIESFFNDFKSRFGREYKSETEETEKFENFKRFLELVDEHNLAEIEAGGSAVHGITKFADISEEEFKSTYLGYKKSTETSTLPKNKPSTNIVESSVTYVDWTGSLAGSIQDQGYCGSCWAYSASEQIHSDSIRYGLLTINDTLSPQQIVSCDKLAAGCDGGDTELAYYYVYKTGGIETLDDYPYTSFYDVTGTCDSNSSDYTVTLSAYYVLETETAMESHILSTGPISVCLDASTWYTYDSGVLSTCGTTVDHCVQAVGLNLEDSDDEYWIIRNSWGTDWGEDGYIYLKAGSNLCDITYSATYTLPVSS